jgi:hypothetical protein
MDGPFLWAVAILSGRSVLHAPIFLRCGRMLGKTNGLSFRGALNENPDWAPQAAPAGVSGPQSV